MPDTKPRSSHPFFMYDHIQAQPRAFGDVIANNRSAVQSLADRLSACRRLFLVGIGTSFHAAEIGRYLLRSHAPDVPCEVWHSFDFAHFGPRLEAEDAVLAISHRGSKKFTRASLERAGTAQCHTSLVTGQGFAPTSDIDAVIETIEQEQSSAHTVSHVAAVAILAELARQFGRGNATDDVHTARMPDALRAGLEREQQMQRWAAEYHSRRRLWLIGAGPTAVTAREIALKIKETSYLQAEGLAIETLLHGPFQCCEADDLFVLIAPGGPMAERFATLTSMIAEIGAAKLLVTDAPDEYESSSADQRCVVPRLPTSYTALTHLVPLQLFTYHLAIERGTNPDVFRLDDPRFKAAIAHVEL